MTHHPHYLQEDVYETEDVPPAVQQDPLDNEEQFEDLDIEKIHVDVENALKRFGRRILNADDTDFSDAVRGGKRRRGYRSGQYVLELVGPEYDGAESMEQKLRRIRYELEEIAFMPEAAKGASKDAGSTSSIDKVELDYLNELLRAASVKGVTPAKKSDIPPDGVSVKLPERSGTTLSQQSRDIVTLEARIKRIERALGETGASSSSGQQHHGSLLEDMENLKIQVETLNPAYLEGINSHLNSALSKLNELDDKRSKLHGEEEHKVNKLYDLVSEWNATCTNLPFIVKRLHSLSKLHEQAQEFSSKLTELTGLRQHVEKRVEDNKVMLFELKKETTKIMADFTARMTDLGERIFALQKTGK